MGYVPLTDLMTATQELDRLFDEWVETLLPNEQRGFSRDGIIHEETFLTQCERILYVLVEPNTSNEGRFGEYSGCDLRKTLGNELFNKPFNKNLGLWTKVLLDGHTDFELLSPTDAMKQLRRVAIMNLKKVGGGGQANQPQIRRHALRDQEFIRKEVAFINPTVIVVCNRSIWTLFTGIMTGSDRIQAEFAGAVVIYSYHPSLRGGEQGRTAFDSILEQARNKGIGQFDSTPQAL